MRIKMTRTTFGADPYLRKLETGKEYDLRESLAVRKINNGEAVMVDDPFSAGNFNMLADAVDNVNKACAAKLKEADWQ